MNKSLCLAASLLALNLTPVIGQQPPLITLNVQSQNDTSQKALTKFNLDFPGGTPKELVAAVEKATGKPLNAIIPDEDAGMKLPPLKLNEVTFPQLSETLRQGSFKQTYTSRRPDGIVTSIEVGYYFRTSDGSATDNSIWFFYVQNPPSERSVPPVQKVCQFYSLAPYLDRGFSVDDITTAIQTGWKMAGETPTPELNYHKETNLLIAFGEPNKLQTIQQVLQTLPTANREVWKPMNDRINELQTQVDQLKRQLNPSPPAAPFASPFPASPVEKSGK